MLFLKVLIVIVIWSYRLKRES